MRWLTASLTRLGLLLAGAALTSLIGAMLSVLFGAGLFFLEQAFQEVRVNHEVPPSNALLFTLVLCGFVGGCVGLGNGVVFYWVGLDSFGGHPPGPFARGGFFWPLLHGLAKGMMLGAFGGAPAYLVVSAVMVLRLHGSTNLSLETVVATLIEGFDLGLWFGGLVNGCKSISALRRRNRYDAGATVHPGA